MYIFVTTGIMFSMLAENTSGAQCFFADGKDMYQIKKKDDDPQEELLYGCSQVS